MKLSELKQIIKEEIISEAKKDKSGLPFALAANIEKYGQPQTPKGAKKVDFTKKQEKHVKKTAEKLKKSIKEEKDNYMFFQNLKTIKQAVEEMLAMDPNMVDTILSNGHDWANDHISTSKDDTEEVYNFLKSKSATLVAEKLKGGQKKLDANKNGKIDAEDFKLLKAKKKK